MIGELGMSVSCDPMEALDWFASPPPAPQHARSASFTAPGVAVSALQGQQAVAAGQVRVQTPGPGPAAGSVAGQAGTEVEMATTTTKPPPAPVTPVTLDELVQSVEEAVGSARARARARAAAAGAETGASNGNAAAGAIGSAESQSPILRNKELDFLTL
ncbi:hypothetical protein VTI74DRAFT_6239 [Chaetomium olivicolor]